MKDWSDKWIRGCEDNMLRSIPSEGLEDLMVADLIENDSRK